MKPRGFEPAVPLDDRRADAGCHVRGMFLAASTEPGKEADWGDFC